MGGNQFRSFNYKHHINEEPFTEWNKLLAVVKANAYGHGDIQIAKAALEAGAYGLAVAILDEAISLRNQGIEAPILVLGASRASDAPLAAKLGIALTVFQKEWLEDAASRLAARRK